MDQISYVNHVLDPLYVFFTMFVFFTIFGCSRRDGGLLNHFVTSKLID